MSSFGHIVADVEKSGSEEDLVIGVGGKITPLLCFFS